MYCRTCHAYETDSRLPEYLNTYYEKVDPELRSEEDTYKKRLDACEKCTSMTNGMCQYCGCFVMVRAAKKHQKCPNPLRDYWNIV